MENEKHTIVGLGNPGEKFIGTRHNLGQEVVVEFAEAVAVASGQQIHWREESGLYRYCVVGTVTCLIPTTFMNDSGKAVAAFLKNSGQTSITIVHDDLELPLGEIKYIQDGSAKGHNGVRSIQQVLGTRAISRLRLGIGRPQSEQPVDEYVLGKFTPTELEQIEHMKKDSVTKLQELTT